MSAECSEYFRNKSSYQARSRAYYLKNKELIKARSAKWVSENRARSLRVKAEYRARRRADLAKQETERYHSQKHNPEFAKKRADYRAKKRTDQRQWSQSRSAELADGYVREMLSKYSPISSREWPQELVEVKRLELMCARLTGDKRYKQTTTK